MIRGRHRMKTNNLNKIKEGEPENYLKTRTMMKETERQGTIGLNNDKGRDIERWGIIYLK